MAENVANGGEDPGLTQEQYDMLFGTGDVASVSQRRSGQPVWIYLGAFAVVAIVALLGWQQFARSSARVAVGVEANGLPVSSLQVTDPDSSPELPPGFEPAADAVDIHVDTYLETGPWTVRLPGTPPPDDSLPVVLHRNDLGIWETLPATYQDGHYLADFDSFSLGIPGWIKTGSEWVWDNTVDPAADWLSGRTDPPEPCEHSPDQTPWASTSGPPSDGLFHICIEPKPDLGEDFVEVRLKSNRSNAMWIVAPTDNAEYVWIEGSPQWDIIGPILNGISGDIGVERILLPPGREMTLGYRQPEGVSANYEIFGFTDNRTVLFSGLSNHIGLPSAYLGTVWAAVGCIELGEDPADVSASQSHCLEAAAGLTEQRINQIATAAIADGRLAIELGDWQRFSDNARIANQAKPLSEHLASAGRALGWGRLALNGWLNANDAATGLSERAGLATVTLVAQRGASDPAEAAQAPDLATDVASAIPRSVQSTFATFGELTTVREGFPGFDFDGWGNCLSDIDSVLRQTNLNPSPLTGAECSARVLGATDFNGQSYVNAAYGWFSVDVSLIEEEIWREGRLERNAPNFMRGEGELGPWYAEGVHEDIADEGPFNGYLNITYFVEPDVAISLTTSAQEDYGPDEAVVLFELLEQLLPAVAADVSLRFEIPLALPLATGEYQAPALLSRWSAISWSAIPSVCGHPPTRLIDAEHSGIDDGEGVLRLAETLYDSSGAIVDGINSNVGELTVVPTICSGGGVGYPAEYIAFDQNGRYHSHVTLDDIDWSTLDAVAPGRGLPVAVANEDGDYVATVLALKPGDGECCPSEELTIRLTVTDRIQIAEVTGPPVVPPIQGEEAICEEVVAAAAPTAQVDLRYEGLGAGEIVGFSGSETRLATGFDHVIVGTFDGVFFEFQGIQSGTLVGIPLDPDQADNLLISLSSEQFTCAA